MITSYWVISLVCASVLLCKVSLHRSKLKCVIWAYWWLNIINLDQFLCSNCIHFGPYALHEITVWRSSCRELPGIMGAAAKLAIGAAEQERQRETSMTVSSLLLYDGGRTHLGVWGRGRTYPRGRLALPWACLDDTEKREFSLVSDTLLRSCEMKCSLKWRVSGFFRLLLCTVLFCCAAPIQKSPNTVPAVSCQRARKWVYPLLIQ